MRKALVAALAVVPMLVLIGCGTATFDNAFLITVADPSHRLGAVDAPVEVSVFDPQMGSSREWAGKTMGTATPDQPYAGTVPTTDTKFFFDHSPPAQVAVGVAIPGYADNGWFSLRFSPADGKTQDVVSGFVPYAEQYPEGNKVVPLLMTITSVAGDEGWASTVVVHIPER